MTATDEFFTSLRSAFGSEADPLRIAGSLLLLLLIVSGVVLAWLRARQKARRELREQARQLGRARGLGRANVEFAIGLAERSGTAPLEILTRLVSFERATARELALRAAGSAAIREATARQIAELRAALGFDVLPPDQWLATTRELKPGDLLQAGATRFEVAEVSEAALTVIAQAAQPDVLVSPKLALEVIRSHDARYAIACRVLDAFRVEGRQCLRLAHDEAPERVQQREFVRVRVARPVSLRRAEGADAVVGQLVEISAGGMSCDAPVIQNKGTACLCSFELGDGAAFTDVTATVLACTPLPGGRFHVRVAFTGLSPAAQDRLAAAVARCEQQEAAARLASR